MGLFRRTRFEPDGYYSQVPYRAAKDGGVEALVKGKIQKFKSVGAFVTAIERQAPQVQLAPAVQASRPAEISKPPTKSANKNGCGCLFVIVAVVGVIVLIGRSSNDTPSPTYSSTPPVAYTSSTKQRIVDIINEQFGEVCSAKLEGFWSDALRIDWRASTTKLHSVMVFAAIGKSKETLYESGIRYLKFPNDAGGYNIIDWKTGEKSSISERAPYYF